MVSELGGRRGEGLGGQPGHAISKKERDGEERRVDRKAERKGKNDRL